MGLFDLISPVYGLFFGFQRRIFREALRAGEGFFGFRKGESVLDIGCGTGAFASLLADDGCVVTAVDPSPGMLGQAKKRNAKRSIRFEAGDAVAGLSYSNASFDVVVSSFVAHGLKPEARRRYFRECKRLARRAVVFLDYNKVRKSFTDLVEYLEGGDYQGFIATAEEEMQDEFGQVLVRNVHDQSAFYVCPILKGGN